MPNPTSPAELDEREHTDDHDEPTRAHPLKSRREFDVREAGIVAAQRDREQRKSIRFPASTTSTTSSTPLSGPPPEPSSWRASRIRSVTGTPGGRRDWRRACFDLEESEVVEYPDCAAGMSRMSLRDATRRTGAIPDSEATEAPLACRGGFL
jgi:hypothetical protein